MNKHKKTLTVLVPLPDLVVKQARAYAKHDSDGKEGEHNNNPNGQRNQAIGVSGKVDITGQRVMKMTLKASTQFSIVDWCQPLQI